MPQLIPFYFINQVTYTFLLLIFIIYMYSKYFLPIFVRIFSIRAYIKKL